MRIWIHRTKSAFGLLSLGALLASGVTGQVGTDLEPPNPDELVENYKIVGQKLEGVLEILSQLTDRSILRPQALPTPEITFDSGGPISISELVLALESLLSLNGIGVSPLGDRFLKVVPLNEIRTQAPELVVDSLTGRDPSGKVVSKLFRLQHLDSQTFQQQIQPFLSPGFSSIIPFQNSNAVIVTDTVSNLQRLEYVVGEVDKPSRLDVEPVFFTLQYAQASEVAQQIQGMIDDARSRFGDQSGQRTGNARRTQPAADAPPPPPGTSGASEGEGSISQILFGSNTAISADDRTNQIIIMTAPSNLQFFENIIQKLDIQADPSTRIEVIPLKHADAGEVASLLSQFVSGKSKSDPNDRTGGRVSSRTPLRTGRSATFGNQEPTVDRAAPENAATGAQMAGAASEDRDSQFSSFMTILPDERSNSLVISGTRSDLELMGVLVEKIDLLLPQVRIEVIIAEVNLNESVGLNRGMDAFAFAYAEQEDGSADIAVPAPGLNFLGLGLDGTFNYDDGVISNLTMNVIFNTIKTNSYVSLLSAPTITTTHNKEASFIVAQGLPIITSSQSSVVSDSFRQSVQYQDIGIELKVRPLIGPNNVIQLEIDQKIDDVADFVEVGDTRQPIIGRRQATSYVSVADGELVVLGGLQSSRASENKSRMAFFGEIPILGKLFRKRTGEETKSELLVFIRPQIIRGTDDVHQDAVEKVNDLEGSKAILRFLETGKLDADLEVKLDEWATEKDENEEPAKPRNMPRGFRKQ